MVLGLYLSIVIALPLALGSLAVYRGLPRSHRCPRCADDTVRLRSRSHDIVASALRRDLQLRWCLRCGWQGTARGASRRVARPPASTPATADPCPADRVDLRSVRVDGHTWRVMIECWAEDGRWIARLVFEEPGGRVCHDHGSLEGDSALDVISRAYRLPDDSLAGRLRRSIR